MKKIYHFWPIFPFFSHLLSPQLLGTHFFGILTIFYVDIDCLMVEITYIGSKKSKRHEKIYHFWSIFPFFSRLLSPKLLRTHFFGFLMIFYVDIDCLMVEITYIGSMKSKRHEKNLSFLANFPIFLTFAVSPASRDPFFWIPDDFLRQSWLFHRILMMKMTFINAYRSKKQEKSHCHHHPQKVATKNMTLTGIQSGNGL